MQILSSQPSRPCPCSRCRSAEAQGAENHGTNSQVSPRQDTKYAAIAQLAEQLICNQKVRSSILRGGTRFKSDTVSDLPSKNKCSPVDNRLRICIIQTNSELVTRCSSVKRNSEPLWERASSMLGIRVTALYLCGNQA